MKRKKLLSVCLTVLALGVVLFSSAIMASARTATSQTGGDHGSQTTTPIKHVVVIFQENVSFDHYFGTYPSAMNLNGEPRFTAAPGTPSVNGLTPVLLTANPNTANPQRLNPSQALTCDQNHSYTAEQAAVDNGLMDKFVQDASGSGCTGTTIGHNPATVMDYYDGNTVTGLWNYAQNYAMSDNSFGTTFGPSTPGALNLIAGQTHGTTPANFGFPGYPVTSNGTFLNDADPAYDACSKGTTVSMSGQNIGNLLNAQNTTWGWFQGGFTPTSASGVPVVCGSSHQNIGGATVTDYSPHHSPFQYYQSTSNPTHLPPSSPLKIGQTDQANHQYDISSFWTAFGHGYLPSVSFLKAPAYQDGHAGYSDPLDEQHFLVDTINKIETSSFWKDTAVIINYDDSDGWYDHVMGPIVSHSADPNDALTGPGACGTSAPGAITGRCGYGPRLPLMVISPFAKKNYIDNTVTDQSSIIHFIEDNWKLPRLGNNSSDALAGSINGMFNFQDPNNSNGNRVILDPQTGERV